MGWDNWRNNEKGIRLEIPIFVTREQTHFDECSVNFITNLCYVIISNPLQSNQEARQIEKGLLVVWKQGRKGYAFSEVVHCSAQRIQVVLVLKIW